MWDIGLHGERLIQEDLGSGWSWQDKYGKARAGAPAKDMGQIDRRTGVASSRRAGAITGQHQADVRALSAGAVSARAKRSNQRPDWPGDWPTWPFGLKLGQQISLGLHHPGQASSRAHDGAL
jgi:hypothetical protein